MILRERRHPCGSEDYRKQDENRSSRSHRVRNDDESLKDQDLIRYSRLQWNLGLGSALRNPDVDQPPAEENAMPRVVPDEPADVVTDAVDLLTRDHRLMEELFTCFFQAAPQQLDPLARRLCKMIRIHTQIEEELFYPAARRAAGTDRLVDESEREH